MQKRIQIVLGLFVVVSVPAVAWTADRPNIVIIMSDDMGYSDLGCYGGTDANTPHLDALASGGVRFTQFYNTARCCPTRASLLTGLYPHQAGVGHMMDDRGHDGYRGNLNRNCVTIAEVLRPAGYRTYMTGKWHVTKDDDDKSSQSNWPCQRGFDKYYGTLVGAGNFFNPNGLCRQSTLITCKTDPEYRPEQFYYTDAISDNAVRFLQQHETESPDKPFFLYVAYTAAHWPMQALQKDLAKYRGKFDDGYAPHRTARLEKMKQLGLLPSETTLSPAAEDWSKVDKKEWETRCMEVYCAMIDNMDAGIGRIVAELKESQRFENTLILFLQDNGACAEGVGRAAGEKRGETLDGRPVQTGHGVLAGPENTFIAYGRGWANVSNTPFREYKHWVHEGGISTPLIAHWPGGISSDRAGKLESQPAHLIDLMATCVDLSGAKYPTTVRGQAIKPREGVSLRPAFVGQPLSRPEPLYWEHEANKAIRDGKWKLVAKADQPWELYNIETDRIESTNLAKQQPELVKRLGDQWEAYAARANVLPLRPQAATNAGNPTQAKFELESDTELSGNQAPRIVDRGFRLTAKITMKRPKATGVIVSQGGSRLGYVLYMKDGKPIFGVRTADGLKEIEGTQLMPGTHELTGILTSTRRLSLLVDGQPVGEEIECVLIASQPGEGLLVGHDEGGAVGNYRPPNRFSEKISEARVELEPLEK